MPSLPQGFQVASEHVLPIAATQDRRTLAPLWMERQETPGEPTGV
jgi:hypothetical protein